MDKTTTIVGSYDNSRKEWFKDKPSRDYKANKEICIIENNTI
jgi:hypothetical protein